MKTNLTIAIAILTLCLVSCEPEAKWTDEEVEVTMEIRTISAGFIECSFSTNKDAYYLISIEEPWEDFNPQFNSKQFMQLALDSAYSDYLRWRNNLLRNKEFNIAPFASHSLQYGSINHFFTGLLPDTDYWLFAFPVNPETMKPIGKLQLVHILTSDTSIMNVKFDYRVKGDWDYIYPIDEQGNIVTHFPYIATTRDSSTFSGFAGDPILDLGYWALTRFISPDSANVLYGVSAMENDAVDSYLTFEEGHTYYTAISGYDGSFKQFTLYKFHWTEGCEYFFTDSMNIAKGYFND